MNGGEYFVGLIFFCIIFGSSLAVALFLLRPLPALRGAERWVAFGLVATASLIAVHMVPGVLGVLTRWTVGATSLLALLGAWYLARAFGPQRPAEPDPSAGQSAPAEPVDGIVGDGGAGHKLLWAAAVGAVAAYLLAVLLEIRTELIEPATTVDTTTFHLPEVASWIRAESFWGIHQFIPLQAHANYPQNGDVVHLATVLPWRNDAFARPIGWVYVALAAVAVYAIGRRLGGGRPLCTLTALAFASVPALILSTTSGTLTDPILIALYGAGLVFLARHASTGAWSDLVLAGLGLGLAFGTKWYGVSSVIITVGLWSVLRFAAERERRGLVVRQAAALTGIVAASGGFWLLRNWVGSGNPVFPVKVEALGLNVFDAPVDTVRQRVGWSISDYIGDPDLLTGPIADGLWSGWSLAGCLLLAFAALATVLALPRWREAGRSFTCFLICLAPLLLAVYLITPYTALGLEGDPFGTVFNVRYSLPALVVAAPLLPWAARRLPALALPLAGAALLGVVLGIREGFEPSGSEWAALIAGAVAAAAASAAASSTTARHLSRRMDLAGGAVVLLAVAVLGYDRQRAFNDVRYEQDPVLAWIAENAPAGHRVGLDGEWTVTEAAPVLPAFGPDFGNSVEYVGSLKPGFLTPWDDEREWQADVKEEGYDLILVGRFKPQRAERVIGWSRASGFRVAATSPNFVLLRRQ